jgi:UDP-glucose 4-epimerase
MKNILVTGGAGYIGSHIIEILVKNKYKVVIVDNLITGHKKLINRKAKFYKLNILQKKKLRKIILENEIDSVIHLAASLSVGVGEKFPKRYYKNNVIATQSLIDSCKHTNVKNFIFSSTAAVYKDGLQKVSEKSPIKPVSVYGKTKLKAENLIIKNCKKYKINYGVLRYFNVVGSSPTGKIGLINNGDHLFKNFSKEILKKKPKFKIYGKDYNTPDKTTIRDYVHVSDLAEIHIKVLNTIKLIKKSVILNCGYGKGVSVLQTANEFKRQSKKKVKIQIQNRRAGDMKIIVATNKKLIKLTKWKSKYNNLNFLVKSSIAWERKLLRK